jgi:hypothetical protein
VDEGKSVVKKVEEADRDTVVCTPEMDDDDMREDLEGVAGGVNTDVDWPAVDKVRDVHAEDDVSRVEVPSDAVSRVDVEKSSANDETDETVVDEARFDDDEVKGCVVEDVRADVRVFVVKFSVVSGIEVVDRIGKVVDSPARVVSREEDVARVVGGPSSDVESDEGDTAGTVEVDVTS